MVFVGVAQADERPNFIFYITDDVSQEDLGCYGHPSIQTPNLDRMAAEGIVFESAYLAISSCSPSRCSTITGRYPHNTGAAELHTELPEGQPLFPKLLRDAGYYTVISGKHHMGPNADPAFELISAGKGPGKQEDWVEILAKRPQDKPFFLWFASSDAHRGWTLDDKAPTYKPEDVVVPPYLVDGPKTRQDLAEYYHEVSRTDYYAGEVRKELERQGIADNTYVIYCSDNGRPFPRGKTYLYDSGIKTPLIIWAPGNIAPARTKSLVSSIDISATVLELAGVEKPAAIQGVSFAPVLENPTAVTREVVFSEHNWHVYQNHERLVRMGEFAYIKNAWPGRHNLCVESDASFPAGEELWEWKEAGKLEPRQLQAISVPQQAEQLYKVDVDPKQLNNLAGSPEYSAVLVAMRALLARWTDETGDTVPENPTNDRYTSPYNKKLGKEAMNPDHAYGEMPGAAKNATQINAPGPVRR
jgi:arylsulfatase